MMDVRVFSCLLLVINFKFSASGPVDLSLQGEVDELNLVDVEFLSENSIPTTVSDEFTGLSVTDSVSTESTHDSRYVSFSSITEKIAARNRLTEFFSTSPNDLTSMHSYLWTAESDVEKSTTASAKDTLSTSNFPFSSLTSVLPNTTSSPLSTLLPTNATTFSSRTSITSNTSSSTRATDSERSSEWKTTQSTTSSGSSSSSTTLMTFFTASPALFTTTSVPSPTTPWSRLPSRTTAPWTSTLTTRSPTFSSSALINTRSTPAYTNNDTTTMSTELTSLTISTDPKPSTTIAPTPTVTPTTKKPPKPNIKFIFNCYNCSIIF